MCSWAASPRQLTNITCTPHCIGRFPHAVVFCVTGHGNDEQLRKRVLLLGAEYVSAWDAFCDGEQCLTRVDRPDDLVAYDAAYFTVPAATYLAKTIAPLVVSPI